MLNQKNANGIAANKKNSEPTLLVAADPSYWEVIGFDIEWDVVNGLKPELVECTCDASVVVS